LRFTVSKFDSEERREEWARSRKAAEEALTAIPRRYLEEIRATPGGVKTYRARKHLLAIRRLERSQQTRYGDGSYPEGHSRCLVQVAWADDSVTVRAL
jgi:hypothetical protein